MNESDNPYLPPRSSADPQPRPRTYGLAWLLLETAVAIAIGVTIVWLIVTGPRP